MCFLCLNTRLNWVLFSPRTTTSLAPAAAPVSPLYIRAACASHVKATFTLNLEPGTQESHLPINQIITTSEKHVSNVRSACCVRLVNTEQQRFLWSCALDALCTGSVYKWSGFHIGDARSFF